MIGHGALQRGGGDFVRGNFRHNSNFAAGPSDMENFAATGDAQGAGTAPNCAEKCRGESFDAKLKNEVVPARNPPPPRMETCQLRAMAGKRASSAKQNPHQWYQRRLSVWRRCAARGACVPPPPRVFLRGGGGGGGRFPIVHPAAFTTNSNCSTSFLTAPDTPLWGRLRRFGSTRATAVLGRQPLALS